MSGRAKAGNTGHEDDAFVSLLAAAREDPRIRETLLAVLAQERFQRHSLLNTWIGELRLQGAPVELLHALSFLLDDATADRARAWLESEA